MENNSQIIAVFETFEKCLGRYYNAIEENRKYQDSELAETRYYVQYGYCNGIYLAICKLGLEEEFSKWAKARKLNYYDVLVLVTPKELRGKARGAYFVEE